MIQDDTPDVDYIELAGFGFDLTCDEDAALLDLCLEALGEADKAKLPCVHG